MGSFSLETRLKAALQEDLGRGDMTTQAVIPASQQARAQFELRQSGVVSGLSVAQQVFSLLDPNLSITWLVTEGEWLDPKVMGYLTGSAHVILMGERVALNLLQRLSGISTLTYRCVKALEGTSTILLDTRKTTPLWRDLEKQAVRTGGGHNHRLGLDDGILIKDNHIAVAGGIPSAIQQAKNGSYLLKVECEVTTLEELKQALFAGADRVLLDNMTTDQLHEAHRIRQDIAPQITLEASGNMTLERLPEVAATGIDFISMGALTHSAPALDIALEIVM